LLLRKDVISSAFRLTRARRVLMSWKYIFGSELNLGLLELALALAGSSIIMLCAVLLFLAYNFFENELNK
jgi:hypothetical protein